MEAFGSTYLLVLFVMQPLWQSEPTDGVKHIIEHNPDHNEKKRAYSRKDELHVWRGVDPSPRTAQLFVYSETDTVTGVTRSFVMVRGGELGYANEGPQLNVSSPHSYLGPDWWIVI